jgi:murein DD-endopeptidase MepM/ murein hydrolase activator NlpD
MPRCRFFVIMTILSAWFAGPTPLSARLSDLLRQFAEFPSCGLTQRPCLPTPNRALIDGEREDFAARTITNEEYGLPGWTRGQGGRFHKGVDILPVNKEMGKGTVRIDYYDPKTRRDFTRREPIIIPKDEIFAILDGRVVVANETEARSGYGRYVMIEHSFADGTPFISMYAHMNRLEVTEGETVRAGQRIGWMGSSSSRSGARNYLKAIPHCHFEVGRVIDHNFPKTREARRMSPPMLGGKYDPRNIQPYNPIDFLLTYRARPVTAQPATSKDSRETASQDTASHSSKK